MRTCSPTVVSAVRMLDSNTEGWARNKILHGTASLRMQPDVRNAM